MLRSDRTKKTQDLVTNLSQYLVTDHKLSLFVDSSQSTLGPAAERKWSLIFDSNKSAPGDTPVADKKLTLLVSLSRSASSATRVTEDDSSLLANSSLTTPSQTSINSGKSSLLIDSTKSAIHRNRGLLSLDAIQPSQIVSKARFLTWYNGILGNVTIQKKSKFVGSVLNVRAHNARSISKETVIVVRPSFLGNHYELHIVESFGCVSRTLNVDHFRDYKDPVFEMCRSGDISGLNEAFGGRRASPNTVNSMGTGLLHVGNVLGHRAHCF